MTQTQNVKVEAPGWRVEPLSRHGSTLLIFYKDGEVRGQIEARDPQEVDLWITLTSKANGKNG